jgi:hypothetical protein
MIKKEKGHIEIGITMALIFIIIFILTISAKTGIHYLPALFDLWMSQPLWLKIAIVILPIILLIIGSVFEKSRQWPKV